jgi:hypothetical protein
VTRMSSLADGTVRYLAEVPAGCSFEIEIGKNEPPAGSQFSFASAALVRRPNSDCTSFLSALAPELGSRGGLPSPHAVNRINASVAILGTKLSRSTQQGELAGSFAADPPGSWTSTKLFLADGEGEVFLNLNLDEGIGEFSLKDEDYASIVVTELAKVLLPQRRAA